MRKLRPYQAQLVNEIYGCWNLPDVDNVMAVLPTGGGKTPVMGKIANDFDSPGIIIAHRKELVSQVSQALAVEGVYHDLLTTDKKSKLRRQLSDTHLRKFGKNMISDRARWFVAGIDTLVGMAGDPRLDKIHMCMIDEGHHVLRENKWGRGYAMLPNVRFGLLPTATPRRADKRGLGSDSHGIADAMVEGPQMRQLINMGYLTDYQLACPVTKDLDLSNVGTGSDGDHNIVQLRKAVHKSKEIVGNIVDHYLRLAKGKLGLTFAVDVDHASIIAQAYRDAGVPAEVISGETPDALRIDLLARFERREILQLVSVDLIGEGFDLPAIEVISMARPTKSFALFCQQFGRALRLMIAKALQGAWDTYTDAQRRQHIAESIKPYALLIDHVGNMVEHNFPDRPQVWTLDAGSSRGKSGPSDAIPLRSCSNHLCEKAFERSEVICPYCFTPVPPPKERKSPAEVDGDLLLLTQEVLAKMRGDVAHLDAPCRVPPHVGALRATIIANHAKSQNAQHELRHEIALWAGRNSAYSDRVNHKRFFFMFNMTVVEAAALKAGEAEALRKKIMLT